MNAAEFLAIHNPPLIALCVAGRSGAYVYADRAVALEALEEVLQRDPPVDAALAIRGDGDGVIWAPGGRGDWQSLGYGAGQLGIGLDHDGAETETVWIAAVDVAANEGDVFRAVGPAFPAPGGWTYQGVVGQRAVIFEGDEAGARAALAAWRDDRTDQPIVPS